VEASGLVSRDESAYTVLAEHHAPRIRAALAQWCENVSLELLAPPQKAQVAALTVFIVVCPQIALLECSRQTGFLAGYLSFDIDPQRVPLPDAVIEIEKATLSDVVVALNRRTKIFPERTRGQATDATVDVSEVVTNGPMKADEERGGGL
jgi:hypothetical protein